MSERSLVEYFSEHEKYQCGYCNSPDSNYSHGMWAHFLTEQDYQDLIDRGWRRSGKYCYKPTMNLTCCPLYTVRCHAVNFKISPSQKKIIKRVNRYLIHGIRPPTDKTESENNEHNESDIQCEQERSLQDVKEPSASGRISELPVNCSGAKRKTPKPGLGANPNKPLPRKAKEIRMERKKLKLAQCHSSSNQFTEKHTPTTTLPGSREKSPKEKQAQAKTLEDLLDEPNQCAKVAHKLEIRLVRSKPRSATFESTFKESHRVYSKYQIIVHNDSPEKPNEKQFSRFLVDSPLVSKQRNVPDDPPNGFGSFHQQYILDGKIIGVGVIDILPNCISSVYFYYDPEYAFLSLGTYSGLREIAMTRAIHKICSSIEYYYMGFYVHSCPKMRYKGQYYPSYLLCPESYTWYPIEKCLPKLEQSVYSRFSEPDVVDENGEVDPNEVLILHLRGEMSYELYQQLNTEANDLQEVTEYAKFVGKKCANHMLLFRV